MFEHATYCKGSCSKLYIPWRGVAATKSPLNKGGKGVVEKLAKTYPPETRPRKNGEWVKEVFTE